MIRAAVLLVVCSTSSLGCAEALSAAQVCETPAEIQVTLASGALLNPDESGAPLPTEVRVLELRDPTLLENTVFEDAWAPAAPLSDTIVSTQSVTLYPGETAALAITFPFNLIASAAVR